MALHDLSHYKSLMCVLDKCGLLPIFTQHKPITLNIVDYDCGCGKASLTYLDFLFKQDIKFAQLHFILIESSYIALEIAVNLIEKKAKQYNISICITAYHASLDDLPKAIFSKKTSDEVYIHLCVHILNSYCDGFSEVDVLFKQIKHIRSLQYVYAISFNFGQAQLGVDAIQAIFQPDRVIQNESRYIGEFDQYDVIEARSIQKKLSLRVYVAEKYKQP